MTEKYFFIYIFIHDMINDSNSNYIFNFPKGNFYKLKFILVYISNKHIFYNQHRHLWLYFHYKNLFYNVSVYNFRP